LGTRRIIQMAYLCMPSGYFWRRTSENAQKAKFVEEKFYALR
jgi:hypothetical protein